MHQIQTAASDLVSILTHIMSRVFLSQRRVLWRLVAIYHSCDVNSYSLSYEIYAALLMKIDIRSTDNDKSYFCLPHAE